jgi:hypothetical protein
LIDLHLGEALHHRQGIIGAKVIDHHNVASPGQGTTDLRSIIVSNDQGSVVIDQTLSDGWDLSDT